MPAKPILKEMKAPLVLVLSIATAALAAAPLFADSAMEGVASWYGGKFHGRLTSSGEVFDTNEMTAAHRDLPFGTMVRVTNLDNGRSTIVKINDRGPFVEGRIIDLSRAAAQALDMLATGVARVSLEIVAFAGDKDVYAIQVGAYGREANAERARAALESDGFIVTVEKTGLNVARVLIRGIPAPELEETRHKLEALGYLQYLVRKEKTESPAAVAQSVVLPLGTAPAPRVPAAPAPAAPVSAAPAAAAPATAVPATAVPSTPVLAPSPPPLTPSTPILTSERAP